MSDEPEFEIHTFPVHDTGIGIEAGFKSDADLIAHDEARRAKLDQWERDVEDDLAREIDRRIIFGEAREHPGRFERAVPFNRHETR